MLVEVVDLFLADRGLHDDRRERVEPALVDLPLEFRRLDVEHGGQPLHELVTAFAGHVPGPELDGSSGDVRHDHAPAPVENRPSRRFDSDQAQLIALRGVEELLPGQHLQRPQPEEQDDKHEERERAEDRDAQGELRRRAGAAREPLDPAAGSAPTALAAPDTGRTP